MLPINDAFTIPRTKRVAAEPGAGPALIAGWIGGIGLGALALLGGLGWLAALLAYSLGASVLLIAFALLPHIELPRAPTPRPAFARARRGPRVRP